MVSRVSSTSGGSRSWWGEAYSACAGQGQQREREQGTHPGRLGPNYNTTRAGI